MSTTATVRLEALEAEAFRAQHHQAQVAARLDHITNALGDLSQDGRVVAFDIREIRTELTEIRTELGEARTDLAGVKSELTEIRTELGEARTDLAGVKSEMRQGLASIMTKLDALGSNG